MRHLQRGVTLIELIIAVALSMSLILILIHLHLHVSQASARQQSLSRQLENAAALVHLFSHSLRDAIYTIYLSDSAMDVTDDAILSAFGDFCPGVSTGGTCLPPVKSWTAGESGGPVIAGALAGTSILQVKQICCEEWVADQFYLAHRGGSNANPVSLYRRRIRTDGSSTAAVELIEGVSELNYAFIVEDHSGSGLALVDSAQVTSWWQIKAIRVRALMQDVFTAHADEVGENNDVVVSTGQSIGNEASLSREFQFTVVGRQWQRVSSDPQ